VAEQDEFLNLAVILRSVAASPNGDGFRHGLEFVNMASLDKVILTAFVHQTFVDSE
jgi:hypothetical protein